jgi:hypothetical protein
MYSDGGYLAKTITHIVAGRRIDFDVIEQSIRYAGRILLKGGTIQIESHDDDTSSVRMLTRYELRGPARLIPRVFIDYVVSAMHKIVIRDMQVRLAPAPPVQSLSNLLHAHSYSQRMRPATEDHATQG